VRGEEGSDRGLLEEVSAIHIDERVILDACVKLLHFTFRVLHFTFRALRLLNLSHFEVGLVTAKCKTPNVKCKRGVALIF
jgi:hypothetical protein